MAAESRNSKFYSCHGSGRGSVASRASRNMGGLGEEEGYPYFLQNIHGNFINNTLAYPERFVVVFLLGISGGINGKAVKLLHWCSSDCVHNNLNTFLKNLEKE